MTTIIAEIEAVLNSRPLTYIQVDSTDVLTPFHLYCGTRALDPPDPRIKDFTEMTADAARQRVLKLDKIIGTFWNTWSKDYLTSLRENAINLGRKVEGPKSGDASLLGCLKRCFARRGTPSLIISDNAVSYTHLTLPTILLV